MAEPQAGWYPDPSGNAAKLRYWDGTQWTNDYMFVEDAPTASEEEVVSAEVQPGPSAQAEQQYQQDAVADQTVPTPQPISYQQPAADSQQVYAVDSQDSTLRLIAFIFSILSCVTMGWLIFPLAWLIPMTVHSYGIYKGRKANSVAFGVCMLIFVSLVSGILLLISKKEK